MPHLRNVRLVTPSLAAEIAAAMIRLDPLTHFARTGRLIRLNWGFQPMSITRRQFLAGAVGTWALAHTKSVAAAQQVLLQHMSFPQDLATPTEFYDRLITPTDVFFVRSHFGPPALKLDRKVRIEGLVDNPLEFSPAEFDQFPKVSVTAVLQCAGNGRSIFSPASPACNGSMAPWARQNGPASDCATCSRKQASNPAPPASTCEATTLPVPAISPYLRSIPIERALDETTLLVSHMNDEPLTLIHGAPMRLIVPGWAGDHWVKWLKNLRVESSEPEGFYYETAYRYPSELGAPGAPVPPEKMKPLTRVPIKSTIGKPADGSHAPRGPQQVVGIAFSGHAPISLVEVSIDGGQNWRPARLEGEPATGRWNVFHFDFRADAPGKYSAMARATDTAGNTQPKDPPWNPSGYMWNGWHSVSWEVS